MVSSQDSDDERRQLANLDNTVIAIPLLERLNEDPDGNEMHRVIVELNLLHRMPRLKTKRSVAKMIEYVAEPQAINKILSDDSDQYIYATLSSDQIRKLAQENEQQRGKWASESARSLEDYKTRVDRPIYKIWPDFEVELLLNESVSTVKADAARAAFAAGGRGIVWAVIDSGIDGGHPHFQKYKNLELSPPLTHWDFSADKPIHLDTADRLVDQNLRKTNFPG
jgi:hypothetical protein